MIYLRSLLHEYIYTTLWSINFTQLWVKLSQLQPYTAVYFTKLTYIGKQQFPAIYKVESLLSYRYSALMYDYPAVIKGSATNFFCAPLYRRGVMRIPITKSLTFLSALQVSIPKKRLWGMGS